MIVFLSFWFIACISADEVVGASSDAADEDDSSGDETEDSSEVEEIGELNDDVDLNDEIVSRNGYLMTESQARAILRRMPQCGHGGCRRDYEERAYKRAAAELCRAKVDYC